MRLIFYLHTILTGLLVTSTITAQEQTMLQLPFADQLPSSNVMHIIEDSEGCLWYATEGSGLCRNDGRRIDVFRSDADHPQLLGDNKICCLAEHGHNIIIGTFHGAYVLNKQDFSIRHLTEVDNKRVDDIITDSADCIWLTANRKIYKFSDNLTLLATYPSQWKGKNVYTARICQDFNGQIWASQWDGGLIWLDAASNMFKEAIWEMSVAPSAIVSDSLNNCLWIGTAGQGIVRYCPETQQHTAMPPHPDIICIDMQLSADGQRLWATTTDSLLLFDIIEGELEKSVITNDGINSDDMTLNRLSLDHRGMLLVANSQPGPFVIGETKQERWYDGFVYDGHTKWIHHERKGLQAFDTSADTLITLPYTPGMLLPVITKRHDTEGIWATDGKRLLSFSTRRADTVAVLNLRPSALADDGKGNIWIASSKGLSRTSLATGITEVVCAEVKDVSALAYCNDGTLWMGTIYGRIFHYADNKLTVNEYASDPEGNAITVLSADSNGNLMMTGDRYTRIYHTQRHTMRLQNRTDNDTYLIELQETTPYGTWQQPNDNVIERIPEWVSSWWMCIIYCLCIGSLITLLIHYQILRKQRKEFMAELKRTIGATPVQPQKEEQPTVNRHEQAWVEKAIAQVELNLANESYNVEQLSADLCMSRMTFYRKLQTLTGQKPSEFIRSIRLRRAAVLLQEGELTVTEISYATGFSSVSYFSRCFRTMFGVPPTLFGKHRTADDLSPNETPS